MIDKPVFIGFDEINDRVYQFPDGHYYYADSQADAESLMSYYANDGMPFGFTRKDYEARYGKITAREKK